jgi:predicted dehydrogenase
MGYKICCCDLVEKKLDKIKSGYPSITTEKDYKKLLQINFIDTIFIATPVATHFQLGWKSFSAGKYVFIE